jgi:hypothetical protein
MLLEDDIQKELRTLIKYDTFFSFQRIEILEKIFDKQ